MNNNSLDSNSKFSTSRRYVLAGMAAALLTTWVSRPTMSQQLPTSDSAAPTTLLGGAELHPAANTDAVVDAVTAFLKTLCDEQRRAVLVEFSPENAGRWSNFPAGVVPRNGIFLRDLNPKQLAAALQIARLTLSGAGFARMQEIRLADDEYARSTASRRSPDQGTDLFGYGNYIIALLGQPSKTEPWMLQFGGHHLAVNHVFRGAVASATPYFVGIESTLR